MTAKKTTPSRQKLDSIAPPILPTGAAVKDAFADSKSEARKYDREARKLANAHTELENKELRDRLAQRLLYARWTFILVASWVFCVLGILIAQGSGAFHGNLSQPLLITTVGSTTVNILGMLAIILHGLYPEKKK